VARPTHTPWAECFPKITNGELRALYRAGFANATQLEIVLYILTQTRGVGRIMAGEVDPDGGWDEWQEALSEYGREAAPLYRGGIAEAIRRHPKHVARELRKLIAARVVVEHERGHKSKKAVLSVVLDPMHWRPSYLHSGANPLPNRGANPLPKVSETGANPLPCLRDTKSETEELCSCEQETPDSGEPGRVHTITTPELSDLQRRLADILDCDR
jgi:hypothetical protein